MYNYYKKLQYSALLSSSGICSVNQWVSLLFCYARLEERHAAEVKQLKVEADELRRTVSQMEKELMNVKTELEVQQEANNRAPTTTMKNLVERLKNQLALKEKQQKVSPLCRKT